MSLGNWEKQITGLRSSPGYGAHLLIVTHGVEYFDGLTSSVFANPDSTQELKIDFFKSMVRAQNKPGMYAINIYYESYVSRPAQLDVNDWCACEIAF